MSQLGLREVFSCTDGAFVLADGGTFNVFKSGELPSDMPVNFLRLAARQRLVDLEIMKSPLGGALSFDFPVSSDVTLFGFFADGSSESIVTFTAGSTQSSVVRYWKDYVRFSCSPLHDTSYVYQVIIE